MAIKKEVREQIKKKFPKLSKRRIDQIIKETQEKYRIVDRDIAGYVLAFEKKISLKRYLEPELVAEVQKAMQNGPKIVEQVNNRRKPTSKPLQIIKLGEKFEIDHPVLPRKIVSDAVLMSEVYPYIYIFENSVRNVIQKTMEKKYGANWWDSKVSIKIKTKVADRMKKENRNKWHGRRGAHQIFYTDISHLDNIITTYWQDFEPLFPSQSWIKAKIEIIETPRNVVSHNNPLSKDDIDSVKLNFKQWTKQIKDFEFE